METMADVMDELTITERAALDKERDADFQSATTFTRDAIEAVFKKRKGVKDGAVAACARS